MIFAELGNGEWLGIGGIGLAAVGAVLGVVASMWTKFKDVLWRFISLVIRRVEVPTEAAHDAITAYLIARYKRSRNYDRMYGAAWEFQRDGRYGLIPYEVFGNRTLNFVDKFPDLPETPAQFQERCAQIALKCFWAEKLEEEPTRPTVRQVAEERLNPTLVG